MQVLKSCKHTLFLAVIILSMTAISCKTTAVKVIDLSGTWQVKLDSLNQGKSQNLAAKPFDGISINLPSTLDDAGLGTPSTLKPALNNYVLSNLTRKHQYIGVAWYQKTIEIPKNWNGKDITLSLERVIWESNVYVDGILVGVANSLIGTHTFDLTKYLSPGKHLLTIAIDNSNKYPLINIAGERYDDVVNRDMAHAYTNHTQIKWNGIIGDIVLEATYKNQLKNLQVYPDFKSNTLRISYETNGPDKSDLNCEISLPNGASIFNAKIDNLDVQGNYVSFEIQRPNELQLWHEFNTALHDLTITQKTHSVTI